MKWLTNNEGRIIRILVILTALVLLATLPPDLLKRVPSICLFKNVFGIECFGCGMTRAMSSVLYLNISEAISYNRLVTIVAPAVFIIFLKDSFDFIHHVFLLSLTDKKVKGPIDNEP